jgi:extradiol dioxygenase family protein
MRLLPYLWFLFPGLLLFGLDGLGQTYDLKDFVKAPPPVPGSVQYTQLMQKPQWYQVEVVDGQLRVNAMPRSSDAIPCMIGTDSLLFVNYGEFGGGIFYKPSDTARRNFFVNGQQGPSGKAFFGGLMIPKTNPLAIQLRSYLLVANGDMNAVLHYKDSLFYFTGYTLTMGNSEGAIFSLDLHGNQFTITRINRMHDNPRVGVVDGDRIWIETSNGAVLKYEDGQVTTLIEPMEWLDYLSPQSMTTDGHGTLYLGMGGGYMTVDTATKAWSFFRYTGN